VRSAAVSASDADVTRRVRALVDESEKRQQRELALRIAELLRAVNDTGVPFRDLETSESSLEEIFVSLVGAAR
jgi:hypothetical protein